MLIDKTTKPGFLPVLSIQRDIRWLRTVESHASLNYWSSKGWRAFLFSKTHHLRSHWCFTDRNLTCCFVRSFFKRCHVAEQILTVFSVVILWGCLGRESRSYSLSSDDFFFFPMSQNQSSTSRSLKLPIDFLFEVVRRNHTWIKLCSLLGANRNDPPLTSCGLHNFSMVNSLLVIVEPIVSTLMVSISFFPVEKNFNIPSFLSKFFSR